jgi:rubredoxin
MMSVPPRAPDPFDHYDTTRTCPACGDTLKSYDKYQGRVLACLGCTWTFANALVPPGGRWLPGLADDRAEHARLEAEFTADEKGGAS